MNKNNICIPVAAKTPVEMVEQIRRAEVFADIIELRLDHLETSLTEIPISSKPFILTYRPVEQGGQITVDEESRIAFWEKIFAVIPEERKIFIDLESDIKDQVRPPANVSVIRSFHDFSGLPENWDKLYTKLSGDSAIAKIAYQANEITDTIPVWKLLKQAKSEDNEIIAIAMGEAGKITRILGLAHGAFLTFGSLEMGSETAPGQISAQDMAEVFRVRSLNEATSVYGIIAGNTSYSTSPFMHNASFGSHELNSVFVPLQVAALDEFMKRMVKPDTREVELNFAGFSVTNPHKQEIIRHLDHIDPIAEKVGAVNTVKIQNGELYGFNTDAPGFIEPLKMAYGDLRKSRAAVFGAGGAARACVYALKEEGADVTLFVRDTKKAEMFAKEFCIDIRPLPADNAATDLSAFDIIVNTTPLGTKGDAENESILTAEHLKNAKIVYDLVYNPAETRLLQEAKKADVQAVGGLDMLIAQGAKQFNIWTGKNAPVEVMENAVRRRLQM